MPKALKAFVLNLQEHLEMDKAHTLLEHKVPQLLDGFLAQPQGVQVDYMGGHWLVQL